ncbi:MAG: MBL fold metallo-hydrolase [Clostridia bacterium]|nr:MBL fold metallo-hydrolase [Clostridia bacterium]
MVANETIKKKGWRRLVLFIAVILSTCFFLTACSDEEIQDSAELVIGIIGEILEAANETTEPTPTDTSHESIPAHTDDVTVNVNGNMEVHFIDVGQSDATLFIHNGKVMLFDVAMASRGDELVEYIQNLGITYIDVVVITHPHDDHAGGAAELLNCENIEVGILYAPDFIELMESETDTPGWYDDMVDAIDCIDAERNEGIPEEKQTSIWHFPRNENGEFAKFNIGDAVVEFLAPLEDEYSDKNDYSICAKITYGNIDIMMTGDATSSVERTLINEGYDLDVEIFQSSHHGSDTGNSREFLDAMTPECIVISCGMKNRYSHPIKSVMDLFKELDLPVYRTDESGNVIMTTDGTNYSFNVEPGTYTSGAEYKAQGD